MQLPNEPSTMPNVRKYSRTFNADRTKVYRQGDQIKIQIPPIQNTYLTKNSKLYFDLNISYQEVSATNAQFIYDEILNGSTEQTAKDMAYGFFGEFATDEKNFQLFSKPFPTLDINGAYGLISKIQVHDYLGTTLLEEIPSHDIITASLVNMIIKQDNVQKTPPDMIENDSIRNARCVLPFNSIKSWREFMFTKFDITWNVVSGTVNTVNTVTTPTCTFAIDLFSVLGMLSTKFVPLHNGFTLSLFVNNPAIPIKFCTGSGPFLYNPLQVPIRQFVASASDPTKPGTGTSEIVALDPSLQDMVLSNVYYKCDLLELPSELDSQVEKVVHTLGYKFQQDFNKMGDEDVIVSIRNRILPSLKSIRRIMVGQRPIQLETADKLKAQSLGFRLKNYIEKFSLEFNKSVIDNFNNPMEVYSSLKSSFGEIDKYIAYDDFTVDEPETANDGQYYSINNDDYCSFLKRVQDYLIGTGSYSSYWWSEDLMAEGRPHEPVLQGKFLVVYDCRIPGTSTEMISGIDSSSNVLEYTMSTSSSNTQNVYIDVIVEHDAVVHVDPGKSTSVSF